MSAPVFCPTCGKNVLTGAARIRYSLTPKGKALLAQIRAAK